MKQNIYIEPETLNKAQENTTAAIHAAGETIKDGSPEEIKAAIHDAIEKSRIYRAFLCANYNL